MLALYHHKTQRYHYTNVSKDKADDWVASKAALLLEQNFKCAICSSKVNFKTGCWDHCHKTLKYRGILCTQCNTMLGMARDNPDILRKGADYLSSC